MLIDALITVQSLIVFHGGLLAIFYILYYILTDKSLGNMAEAHFWLAITATLMGLMFLIGELKLNTLWIDITTFQLSISASYILARAAQKFLKLER
jgi:hypothetical protein